MTVYECRCGFESGTAVGFQRHIARNKGETGKHRMVNRSNAAAKAASKPTAEADIRPQSEAEMSSGRSLSDSVPIPGPPLAAEAETALAGSVQTSNARPAPHNRYHTDVQAQGKLEASSSGGDSSWERVSRLSDSGEEAPSPADDYAALTAQLAASGPAGGTRAKTKRPASAARISNLASQTPQIAAPEAEAGKDEHPILSSAGLPTMSVEAAFSLPGDPASPAAQALDTATGPSAALPSRRGAQQQKPAASSSSTADAGASTSIPRGVAEPSTSTSVPAEQAAASSSDQAGVHGRQISTLTASSPPSPTAAASPTREDLPPQISGRAIVRKSLGMVHWLRASTDAALTLQPATPQSIQALEQRNACSADDVEAVLLWQQPMQTSKVFLGGMYLLICLRQLVLGVELLQPSTAIAGLLLAVLLGNTVRVAVFAPGGRLPRRELALQAQVSQALSRRASQLASLLGAIAVLLHRRLSGHDRTGTTVWLALTLWVIMALGEAALLAQSSMAIAVWCALFGLPCLYLQCRHILDVLVEEALQLVAVFLKAGQRGTLMFAAGAGLLVLMAVPLSLFARLSLAVLTVANVLFWKACMPAAKPAIRQKT